MTCHHVSLIAVPMYVGVLLAGAVCLKVKRANSESLKLATILKWNEMDLLLWIIFPQFSPCHCHGSLHFFLHKFPNSCDYYCTIKNIILTLANKSCHISVYSEGEILKSMVYFSWRGVFTNPVACISLVKSKLLACSEIVDVSVLGI